MSSPEFKKTAAPAATADHYALLGLAPRFAVDAAELERRYLERSREVHPDRFVNAPAPERVRALRASMQLNDAYKTLKQPAARGEHLLARRGVTIGDNEVLDPAFLMEVLELREELAEAKHARDLPRLRALESAMHARKDQALARIAALFAELEAREGASSDGAPAVEATAEATEPAGEAMLPAGEAILIDIKSQLILLRYVARYLSEFDDVIDEEEP